MQTVQLFTKNNNQWNAPALTDGQCALFRAAIEESGIVDPVVHVSYLINLASPDDALWQRSIDAMTIEIERAHALGIRDVVVHPGAHMGSGEKAGITRVAKAVKDVLRRTRGRDVLIDLEVTAGQGSSLGHQMSHLGGILDRVNAPERIGVCLDSCHLFAAGYAMSTVDDYNRMIEELERHVGISRVRVWHLNDSLKPCGSRVDRHAGIGRGCMGLEPFRFILNDSRFEGRPMILETPKGVEAGRDLDVINLGVLRKLARPPRVKLKPSAEGDSR
jgi:deoxyribonuclease-4